MAFNDTRTQAELLLAPRFPLSRSIVNFSSLKLNLGGAVALPGVISDAAQLSGPLRRSLGTALAAKVAVEGVAASVNLVLAGFDAQAAALRNGTFVPPDPMLVVAAVGVPAVASFFSFSTLAPGAPVPANFSSTIQNRKTQLQALSKNFSTSFSKTALGGVTLTENMNPSTYPLPTQLDLPSLPRLAQGGAAAQADPIIKDKIRFAVKGVNIGAGKPSSWSRLLGAAAAAAMPNLNPVVNQLFRDRKNQSTWSEPVTPYATQFPYNRVTQSASGHVIEIDDTPGAERVHFFHRSGSFMEFHPNGTVVYKSMAHGYSISMADQYVKVSGKCHMAVDGGVTLYSKGNVDLQTDGDVNVQAKGDFNVHAKNINLRAKKQFKADGVSMDLRYISLPSSVVPVFAGMTNIGFAPRVNMMAAKEAFPDANFEDLKTAPKISGGAPPLVTGELPTPPPPENPLSNFSVYTAAIPAAVSYRAHLFDTPEETNDFELYAAHVGLQQDLGDVSDGARQLGGTLRTLDTGVVAPLTKPSIDYLNYSEFKGTYTYANDWSLGGTSFTLADVVDVALHPDVVGDTTLTDFSEGVPTDDEATITAGGEESDPTDPKDDDEIIGV